MFVSKATAYSRGTLSGILSMGELSTPKHFTSLKKLARNKCKIYLLQSQWLGEVLFYSSSLTKSKWT